MAPPRTIARLRRALLVLLVLLVGGVVGLYYFGRAGRPTPPRPAGGDGGETPAEGLTLVGEGFDYTLEEEGETLFRIRGKSYQVDREERVYLEEMGVTLYSAEGGPFEVASREAIYDQDTQHTELKGEVLLRGPEGIEMRTDRLELRRQGAVALNNEPVHFTYGEVAEGGAQRLRVDIVESIFYLYGQVWAQSLPEVEPPFGLRSRSLFFERRQHHARADDEVWLSYGPHYLEAQRVNIWLTEDNRLPQFVRAIWEVSGFVGSPPGAELHGPVTYQADKLSVVFAPGTSALHKMELEGTPRRRAVLRSSGLVTVARRLEAGYVVGNFEAGQLASAEAFGGVTLLEGPEAVVPEIPPRRPPWMDAAGEESEESEGRPAGAEQAGEESAGEGPGPGGERGEEAEASLAELLLAGARRITADRAKATFLPGVGMVSATLYDQVHYRDQEQTARGEEARFDFEQQSVELSGSPAEVVGPQGTLLAPHLLYTQSSGTLFADGGTRTRLTEAAEEGALSGSPLGDGEGPVWVESTETFFRDQPRAFLFRGDVRAWRGENLLLAQELEGHEPEGQLEARGEVRTLWHPEPEAGGEGGAPEPIEVTADEMLYDRGAGTLVYRRGVESRQGSWAVSGEEMTIHLGADRRAEVLLFAGSVHMEDRQSGRVIEGARARYEVSARTAEVTGEPVVMRDREGTEVKGPRLLYDLNTGTAQMQGAAEEAEQPPNGPPQE